MPSREFEQQQGVSQNNPFVGPSTSMVRLDTPSTSPSSTSSDCARPAAQAPPRRPEPAGAPGQPRCSSSSNSTESCDCDCPAGSCDCPAPLAFPRRVCALPPVRALAGVYGNVSESNSLLGCLVLAAEVAGVVATAPAVALARPLHRAFQTPVYVADLLLCKGLDLAERAFPCLTATPTQVCRAMAFCACGVPAGACYLSTKFACKALRTCLFDVPSVAIGLPSLLCCSATEICLCDVPAALCGLPGKITLKAAHTALGDAEAFIRALETCSDRIVGRFQSDEEGC